MTKHDSVLKRIRDEGLIAIIRLSNPEGAIPVAEALRGGGCGVIEVTMTVPHALDVLQKLTDQFGKSVYIGMGTVLDETTANAAIDAGAQFIVSPSLDTTVIKACSREGIAIIPGTFTPTEIVTAWDAGADMIKVFPISSVGPRYLRELRAPLPDIPLVPTGGINLENVTEFILAGATAVGVGSSLVARDLVELGQFNEITHRARAFLAAIGTARSGN